MSHTPQNFHNLNAKTYLEIMKKYLAIILFLAFGVMNAQSEEDKKSEPEYKADKTVLNEKSNTLQLIGKVDFKSDILEFKNADEVIWNRNSNEIIVRGIKDFTIDGSVVFSENSDNQTLHYKLGSKIARFE